MNADYIKTVTDAVKAAGGNKTKAAQTLGLTRSAVRRAMAKTTSAPTQNPLEARRQAQTESELRNRVQQLEKQLIAEQDFRKQIESLHVARVEPAVWQPSKPAIASRLTLTPVLFTSDFQVGEVVHPDEIEGINEYNQDIFVERYQKMIDKTIMLADRHTGMTDCPGIIYLRGGDAINGEIHEELAETNDLSSVPACRLLHMQEKEGIRRLKERFGRVRVISLPGNHGRTTRKPHSKHYAFRNFETLLSWWLATSFEDDPDVSFWTSKSADAYFQVEGWNWLMSHGDRIGSRGGQGFVGPAAPIARGHKKLYSDWTQTGHRIDHILTAHFHTCLRLELGDANGALVGYNEYARDLRARPDAPRQLLYFVHKDNMISHRFELQLGPMPSRKTSDTTFWEE